jgi:hypothetical protein
MKKSQVPSRKGVKHKNLAVKKNCMEDTTRTNGEESRAESISCVKIRFVNKNELQTASCSGLMERTKQ